MCIIALVNVCASLAVCFDPGIPACKSSYNCFKSFQAMEEDLQELHRSQNQTLSTVHSHRLLSRQQLDIIYCNYLH